MTSPKGRNEKSTMLAQNIAKRVNSRRLDRIASRAGYTLVELHNLWVLGMRGDAVSDKKIKNLLTEKPSTAKVFEVFSKGSANNNQSMKRALNSAELSKKSESVWVRAKSKWISVSSGGLPTLGKRR